MNKTGVKCDTEDLARMMKRYREAQSTPACIVHGVYLPDAAAEAISVEIDRLAVKYGLPPAETLPDGRVNHYGMIGTGEFTRA